MTTWASDESVARAVLLRVHASLVDIRAAAQRGEGRASSGLGVLADALDSLPVNGAEPFPEQLRGGAPAVFRLAVQPTSDSGGRVQLDEAEAFARAMSVVVKSLANARLSTDELARAMDDLEYLPTELIRVGPAALDGLDDSREPTHVRALAHLFQQELGV